MNTTPIEGPLPLLYIDPHATLAQSTWCDLARQAHYDPHAIAKLCRVSLRTVQRHFQRYLNTTFTAWLTDLRMAEARRRILDGEFIKEVPFDLGFKQPSHFTRVFKSHYGVPPSYLSITANLVHKKELLKPFASHC
jgi:AraC-like DNA-binding protein